MEKNGLTAEDQAALLKGGVTDVSFFRTLDATDFSAVGIDIAARRAAKAKADKERADAAAVLELLQREGGAISPAGQRAIVHSAGTMAKLCALEPAGMQKLGLGIADIRHLRNLLEKSPAVARFRLQTRRPVSPIFELPRGPRNGGFTVQPDGKIKCPSGPVFLLTTQGIVDLTVAVTSNMSWLIGLVPNGADAKAWPNDASSLAVN